MSAEQTRFDWEASESAPEHYPMEIISGDLRYQGSPHGAGLYVPEGVLIYHGWGLTRSSHVTGDALKPLPDRLDITFYSYLEDQFYRGSFDLPYEKILHLFQEAEAAPKRKTMSGEDVPNNYVIIVGVAPGGTVAVWLRNQGTEELFFGKAEKVEVDFAKAFRIPIANREERKGYVEETINDVVSPEMLAAIRRNGIPFDKWTNYRIRYNWASTFFDRHMPSKIGISFYNGEGESFKFPLEKSYAATGHPVPSDVDFSYAINGQGTERYYVVRFDEDEIFDAFTRLSAMQLPMQLEFEPRFPIDQTLIRLHNGKESIPLKKYTVTRK